MHWNLQVGGAAYRISTDPADLDIEVIHQYLSVESYWAKNIPRVTVEQACAHSLCFSIRDDAGLVGFARVITDRATVAYLGDVFILPAHRGLGLSKWLMSCIHSYPDLQNLRRWILLTRDAHGLYARSGFAPLKAPDRYMERHDPDVYARATPTEG
jgi:GNAT superfamily N-acetyltransferase